MGSKGICVWHDGKRAMNLAKHGYDFFDVAEVFDGRPALVNGDRRFEYGEERFNLLARLDERVVNVAFTTRGDVYHLISARPASRRERMIFYVWQERTR